MPLVIHIGMQKTGTTFLQQVLSQNSAELAERGLIYPSPRAGLPGGGGSAHHFLAHAVLRLRVNYTPKGDFALLPDHVTALRGILDAGIGVGVISSEDFSRMRSKQIQTLRAHFPGEDVRILVYLRRQDLWLDALYGQALKVGRQIDLETFIARNRRRLDYARLLRHWANAFGRENLIVRIYEGFEEGGLWADFCHAVGCPAAVDLPARDLSVNVSLSYEASMFLSAITDRERRHRLRMLLEEGEAAGRRRPALKYIDTRQAKALMAEFADSNAEVARDYFDRDALFENASPVPARGARHPLVRHLVVARSLLRGVLATRFGTRAGRSGG